MRVHLHWDNPEQTIIRWEFEVWIGLIDYIIPINDTATMGILNGGKADVIINMGLKLPFPNRHPSRLKAPMLAARSYNLGFVIIVTRNPVVPALIRYILGNPAEAQPGLFIVPSLQAARRLIARLRDNPVHDIQMRM